MIYKISPNRGQLAEEIIKFLLTAKFETINYKKGGDITVRFLNAEIGQKVLTEVRDLARVFGGFIQIEEVR